MEFHKIIRIDPDYQFQSIPALGPERALLFAVLTRAVADCSITYDYNGCKPNDLRREALRWFYHYWRKPNDNAPWSFRWVAEHLNIGQWGCNRIINLCMECRKINFQSAAQNLYAYMMLDD